MAEVLFRYATTYMEEEEPDEATKYLQQLVRRHPNSEYAEKAKEKLAAIGAQVPDADPDALNREEPRSDGMIGGIMREISGVVPKTVNKDGVIISQSKKGNDIIQAVMENSGKLPDNYNRAGQPHRARAHRDAAADGGARHEEGRGREEGSEPRTDAPRRARLGQRPRAPRGHAADDARHAAPQQWGEAVSAPAVLTRDTESARDFQQRPRALFACAPGRLIVCPAG